MTPAKALAGAGVLLANIATLGAYYRRFDWQTGEDEMYLARASDAWPIALYRYRPRGAALPFPVLCAHGLASSRLIFDLDRDVSLARFLAAQGFDTWLVDLRGRNKSWPYGRPDPRLHWSFDEIVEQDLPAAVERVLELSGAGQLFWVGMGLGGQALYAAAERGLADPVRGAVTFAAPAVTSKGAKLPGVNVQPAPRRNGRVLFSRIARLLGPALAASDAPSLGATFLPGSTDPRVIARYLRNAVQDESEQLVDQIADWLREGEMRSRDGQHVYSRKLDRLSLPLLLVGGARDLLQPVAAVRQTYAAVGSEDKAHLEAGRSAGLSTDYGHYDLLTGRAAPRDVFPRVADWLRARS